MDVLAAPLYHASAIYRRVPKLRRRCRIAHLTDGFGDLFSMWEQQRVIQAKAKIGLLKAALVIPQLYACRADLEFNPLHPATTPYAKKSFATGPFPITEGKRDVLHELFGTHENPALIIDGFDLTAAQIADGIGLESFLATRRDGGIIVNGHIELADDIICAEEVLEVVRPSMVIGCPSTVLAAARHRFDDLPVFCIRTKEADRVRGRSFNDVFEKYGRRFGMTFAGGRTLQEQLARIRDMIADAKPQQHQSLSPTGSCQPRQHAVD
jgi:hypothetical protein